jgi:hypothetical protein
VFVINYKHLRLLPRPHGKEACSNCGCCSRMTILPRPQSVSFLLTGLLFFIYLFIIRIPISSSSCSSYSSWGQHKTWHNTERWEQLSIRAQYFKNASFPLPWRSHWSDTNLIGARLFFFTNSVRSGDRQGRKNVLEQTLSRERSSSLTVLIFI